MNIYERLYLHGKYRNIKPRNQRNTQFVDWLTENKPPPARVLEIGCGRGGLLEALQERGYCVHGTEIAQSIIDLCPPHIRVHRAVFPEDGRLFETDSYDVVIASDVLEHLPDEAAVRETLQQMVRITKDFMLVSVGTDRSRSSKWLKDTDVDLHVVLRKPTWWRALLDEYMDVEVAYQQKSFFAFGRVRKEEA